MTRYTKPLSATELSMGRGCLVAWAAKYATEDPRWKVAKDGTQFQVGTFYHKLAEAYAEQGFVPREPNPIVDMFLHSMRYLPVPHSAWAIEQRAEVTIQGLRFELTPDWYGPSDALPSAQPWKKNPVPLVIPKGLRAVVDYKTSKDPQRYGMWSEATKLDDAQTLIYSYVAFGSEPGLFRHLYLRKTGQILALEAQDAATPELKAKLEKQAAKQSASQWCEPSDVVLDPADVSAAVERIILPVGEKLYRIRERGPIDPLALHKSPSYCDQYGGCPHFNRTCFPTATEALTEGFSGDLMSGFDLFSAIPAVNGAPNTPAPAAPTFSFSAPAATPAAPPAEPALAPELVSAGYKAGPNPEFLQAPSGAYERKSEVLVALETWKAQQAVAPTVPAPGPVEPTTTGPELITAGTNYSSQRNELALKLGHKLLSLLDF